jgi:uncharacterized RDD family membrane protein YckC
MRRSSRTPEGADEEPSLFDLPLEPDRASRADHPAAPPADPVLPLAPAPRAVQPTTQPVIQKERPPAPPRPARKPAPVASIEGSAPDEDTEAVDERAPVPSRKSRFLAGAADLLAHAAVAVAAVAGSRLLGASPAASDWPAVALFLLTFSFLYTVLPLAFWGQTLGMAWAGLVARSRDGEALTFDQTARRWLGALVTAAMLGLPLLLAAGGRRSLSDRVSGSVTHWAS